MPTRVLLPSGAAPEHKQPRALVLAVGNPLRGDDGVAHLVVQSMGEIDGVVFRSELQLSPELAADIAAFETVILVDADADATRTTIAPLEAGVFKGMSHATTAPAIAALAASLYSWKGSGWLCSIPAHRFHLGAPISTLAIEAVAHAAPLLRDFLKLPRAVAACLNGNRIEEPPCNAANSLLNPPAR